jgi:glycerol kinase
MAYQTQDVLAAMQQDSRIPLAALKVDGGASANNLLMQYQSDLLNVSVRRPVVQETTALGAAYLAGLAVGFWKDQSDVAANWQLDREFTPNMDENRRQSLYSGWQRAVERSRDWAID